MRGKDHAKFVAARAEDHGKGDPHIEPQFPSPTLPPTIMSKGWRWGVEIGTENVDACIPSGLTESRSQFESEKCYFNL